MRTVAKEAARRGIRVNTLHPGPIDNAFLLEIEDGIGRMAGGVEGTKLLDDMIHLRRHATPDEIARSALYLASDMASFVTAATLMADGADEKNRRSMHRIERADLGFGRRRAPLRSGGRRRARMPRLPGGRRRFCRRSFRLCSLRRIGAGARRNR
jgi:hypothetical protein